MRRRTPRVCLAAALLAFAGCVSPPTSPPGPSPAPPRAAAPASVWRYLTDEYDADADGAVTSAEYPRGEEKFRRLDRDRDGVLTAADFSGPSGGVKDRIVAAQALFQHFQADEDRDSLALAEVRESFAGMDADGNGKLTDAEYQAARPNPGEERSPGHDALCAVADADGSGDLTIEEIAGFFGTRDGDRDGVWTRRRHPIDRTKTGVAAGRPAPDFTLRPPDGGEPVTLSSLAGTAPVALIFGSYT